MKLSGLILAAAAVSTFVAAPALADRVVVHETTTTHNMHGWHGHHRHCQTQWRNHHRVTRCW